MQPDGTLTIMVVDDNKRMREVLMETMAHVPCSFVECASGKEAVDNYPASLPDWVLMDVRMKPMSGIVALTEIRRTHPTAKIIMVSSAEEDEIRTAALKAGAAAFVRKEFLSMIPDLIDAMSAGAS